MIDKKKKNLRFVFDAKFQSNKNSKQHFKNQSLVDIYEYSRLNKKRSTFCIWRKISEQHLRMNTEMLKL